MLLRVAALLSLLLVGAATAATLRAVPRVDLDRYMGLWYVIASYPEDEQEGCFGMRAIYTRTESGFDLLNLCRKGGPKGAVKTLTGSVFVADERSRAKLKARFYLVFSADYWIIDLDPLYGWVVVGEPSREHLWIMSRRPTLGQSVLAGINRRLEAQGYDPLKLLRMPQATP